ncbi:MAG: hypothetical protein NVS2B5_05700 [Beijerinckiaceae bacterium]
MSLRPKQEWTALAASVWREAFESSELLSDSDAEQLAERFIDAVSEYEAEKLLSSREELRKSLEHLKALVQATKRVRQLLTAKKPELALRMLNRNLAPGALEALALEVKNIEDIANALIEAYSRPETAPIELPKNESVTDRLVLRLAELYQTISGKKAGKGRKGPFVSFVQSAAQKFEFPEPSAETIKKALSKSLTQPLSRRV